MKLSLPIKKHRDRAMVIEGEKIEILPVEYYDSEKIQTPYHVFPASDALVKFDPEGGQVFLINCDLKYLQETEHLKRVEESIAIQNIFDFPNQKKLDIPFIFICVVLVITIFLLR